jgi:hypothetical protein
MLKVGWASTFLAAGTIVLMPLFVLSLIFLMVAALVNNPLIGSVPLVLFAWLVSLGLFYRARQHYQDLLARRAVVFGAVLALVPLMLVISGVLLVYFANGVPGQTLYVDPHDNPPFAWQGPGALLYIVAYIGWPLSLLTFIPTVLILLGMTITNWRTMPLDEKQVSSAILIAAAVIALTGPVWGAVGIWLAD